MSRGTILAVVSLVGLAAGLALGYAWRPSTPGALPSVAVQPPRAATPAPSPAPSTVVTITSAEQLTSLLAAHPGPALLDFHAEWCKPCKELEPRIAELSRKRPALLVASIDAAMVEAVAGTYKAEDLPLLVRLENGQEVARRVGAPTLTELEHWLDEAPAKRP